MRKPRPSLLSILLSRLGKRDKPAAVKARPSPFQAISIYRGAASCEMARKFAEHRFLAREAPTLPLPDCSMPQSCQCRYLRFKDRRSQTRRADDFRAATRISAKFERRARQGRRSTD